MAFIIPNATDTGTGNRFGLLDQAEPDSLDFEILGNVSHSGVLSGGAVTANVNGTSVDVASGSIVLNGVPYSFTGGNFSPTAATDRRFDLIVARLSGGSVSIVVVQGNNSPTNPEYPPSTSVLPLGTTFNGAIHIDLATDVVLAAVLRVSGVTITSASIVDKRVIIDSGVYRQGTSAPSGGITGSLYYKTDVAAGATGSGLYVRNSSGTWVEAAQNADNNVTNSRLRDSAGLSVIGRTSDTAGDPADIVAATDTHVLRRSGTSLAFGQVVTGGIADNAVTTAKIVDANVTTSKIASGVGLSYPTLTSPIENISIASSAPPSTVTFDAKSYSFIYYTSNSTTNWTLNFRGDVSSTLDSLVLTGDSMTLGVITTQGSTGYKPSTIQVDGVTRTVKWQGGYSTASTNAIDIWLFTLIKTGSGTWVVLGNLSRYV